MVLNQAMHAEAIEAGLPEERLDWMPNPVDTDMFRPLPALERHVLRRRLGLDEREQVILFVGRLAPEKRLNSLLDAFEQVAASNGNARLVVVGAGPLRQLLEEQAGAGRYAGRVLFTGAQPVEQVRKWMQGSDVFALVSEVEGLPCSLIEAMSAGMTAVVSDIAANTQLISDGERGRVAPVGDVAGIARQLTECLAGNLS